MHRPRVLALVLAGGVGSRLELLTEHRAKPSLPFAGSYRLIDISLSNLMHSGISDVWIVEQYRPHALNDHLASGRPWDLDRSHGGLRVLPPYQGTAGEGFASGNADALHRQLPLIKAFAPELVLVLSADHLYRCDYGDLIGFHLEQGADLTVLVTEVTEDDARRLGVVEVAGARVTGFAYKPEEPRTNLATAEVFLYSAEVLVETLEALADAQEELEDYGDRLLPHLVAQGGVYAYRHEGYWRDVGTLESYWEAHMDLLNGDSVAFDDPSWPIVTASPQRLPARVDQGATLSDSLIAPGSVVAGTVVNSVLGAGVVVAAGATVTDSVLLEGVTVEEDASVVRAIIDAGAVVGRGAQVGAADGDLALIGQRARVAAGERVASGGRVTAQEDAD